MKRNRNPTNKPVMKRYATLDSPIVLLSSSYRSPIGKRKTIRKQYGNNMRSIYAGGEDDTWWVHGLLHEDDDLFDKE